MMSSVVGNAQGLNQKWTVISLTMWWTIPHLIHFYLITLHNPFSEGGSSVVVVTAGYCVGSLNIEGFYAPWGDPSFTYLSNLASSLQILVDDSSGASDCRNEFGEPLIQSYTRTIGMKLLSEERREWLMPIMFNAGIGQIDHIHITKGVPATKANFRTHSLGPLYRQVCMATFLHQPLAIQSRLSLGTASWLKKLWLEEDGRFWESTPIKPHWQKPCMMCMLTIKPRSFYLFIYFISSSLILK